MFPAPRVMFEIGCLLDLLLRTQARPGMAFRRRSLFREICEPITTVNRFEDR